MRTQMFDGALVRHLGPACSNLVLCIHGFADDGTAFTPLAATPLAATFRLAICDLPGFGASAPPRGATIHDYAAFIMRLADALSPDRPVGLIAHSVGSPIAVAAAQGKPDRVHAILSIEGNLTSEDAYFSGRAAEYEDAEVFKSAFSDQVWAMATDNQALCRYADAVQMADADSMWRLGRDAARLGEGEAFGHAYMSLSTLGIRSQYLWGRHNTPPATAAFVDRHRLANREFGRSGHWKSVDAPEETSSIARDLFVQLA